MEADRPTETFDRLHAGLAGKIGPLFQRPAGADDDLTGRQIGLYKVLQKIGSGGFGDVYMAEQEEPVRRRVALKIIKLGMDTKQVIARFEAERQALAMMDHPNIARVLDAAVTETGRPYFVMELVKGEPITAYCDREKLSIAARLDAFAQVCRAVHHAHQKAVIHRDIKPSNVLVSTVDGRPLAKVIDFGIAKATDHRLTEKTLFTEFHQMIGTPEYMSPEQAGGSPDVDTRTDIYSLGVLLYELLTGTPPLPREQMRSAAYAEMQRIIREVEPPTPSVRLGGLLSRRGTIGPRDEGEPKPDSTPPPHAARGASIEIVAEHRQTDPPTLLRTIRGELDWIVMKCIEKDRGRRYDSAGSLAAEIGNYLTGEPVQAAPPSALYRLRKFVRKHRVGVTAGTLVALALLFGLIATTIGLQSAIEAWEAETIARKDAEAARVVAADNERKAANEAAKARAALGFVTEMFGSIDPVLARGHDVTVAEVLEPAAEKVGRTFADDPEGESVVRHVLGQAYAHLARYPDALKELKRAWELRQALHREDDAQTISMLNDLGIAVLETGDVPRARDLLGEALQRREATLGKLHRDTLATRSVLAFCRQLGGDLEGTLSDIRAVMVDQEKSLGASDRDTLESMCSLADMLGSAGKVDEALAAAEEAYGRAAAALGEESNLALMAGSIKAEMLVTLGRDEEAATLLEKIASGKEKLYGQNHPSTLLTLDLLARTLGNLRQDERAIALSRTIAERAGKTLGERHSTTLVFMNNLAQALRKAGQLDEAEPIYRRLIEVRREMDGGDSQDLLIAKSNLGLLLLQRKTPADALPLFEESLKGFRKILPPDHWMLGVALLNLGKCQTALGKYADAERSLLDGHGVLEKTLGAVHGRTKLVKAALAELYDAWGKPEQAEAWRVAE
ncbi:MAG: serine/threonine protein kinase [Phycisphaerales bacterium]|nr:serine/threonine protein kinase [Phycisphaerales bacterium]